MSLRTLYVKQSVKKLKAVLFVMDDLEISKHKPENIDNVVIKHEETQTGVHGVIIIKQEPLEQDSVETYCNVHDSLFEVDYHELRDDTLRPEHLENKNKPSFVETSSLSNKFHVHISELPLSSTLCTNTALIKRETTEQTETSENDVSVCNHDTRDEQCTYITNDRAVPEQDESLSTVIDTNNQYRYEYHTDTQVADNSFACNLCQTNFSKKSTLVRHMRLHTGVNLSVCEICEYKCTDKSSLLKHMRTHTGEKPYTCNLCSYRCAVKSGLKRHKRTHTGEKAFACKLCQYKCSIKSSLVRHVRTHTGEKPWVCEMCNYRCSEASSLVKHMRTHTGERPFACTLCPYITAQNSNLVVHMRTRHRAPE